MEKNLTICLSGPDVTDFVQRMFPCCPCPSVPKTRLSFALSNLPNGATITMPPTTGTPVTVSFPAPLPGAANQTFLFHVLATDQNGATVTPTGLTAVSDNPLLVPSLASDSVSFWIDVNTADALTGNVTIFDTTGDTLVVAISQTAGATVPTITLSGFADAPIAQPHP